jgi:hypothetical protein
MISDAKQTWNKPLFMEMMILGAWNIWKIRNRAHFDGVRPDIQNWKRQLTEDLKILNCRIKESLQSPLQDLITLVSI